LEFPRSNISNIIKIYANNIDLKPVSIFNKNTINDNTITKVLQRSYNYENVQEEGINGFNNENYKKSKNKQNSLKSNSTKIGKINYIEIKKNRIRHDKENVDTNIEMNINLDTKKADYENRNETNNHQIIINNKYNLSVTNLISTTGQTSWDFSKICKIFK
jgi:hypothetical protein